MYRDGSWLDHQTDSSQQVTMEACKHTCGLIKHVLVQGARVYIQITGHVSSQGCQYSVPFLIILVICQIDIGSNAMPHAYLCFHGPIMQRISSNRAPRTSRTRLLYPVCNFTVVPVAEADIGTFAMARQCCYGCQVIGLVNTSETSIIISLLSHFII